MFVVSRTLFRSIRKFFNDDCLTSGAAIAFYTIFSLPPLLVIVLMITSSLGFTKEEVDRIIHDELGLPVTQAINEVKLKPATQAPPSSEGAEGTRLQLDKRVERLIPFKIGDLSVVSKVVGICVLLLSASGSFGQLQVSLNRIWEVAPDARRSWIPSFFLKRFLTAALVLAIGFVLLTSLALTAMIDQVLILITGKFPSSTEQIIVLILNEGATFAVAILLFAAMFKLLPDAKLRWSDVWLGAATTALLFVTGKVVIGWYLRTSEVGSSWGASAASSLAALVWVYYSSLIVLYGAELSNAWATRHGTYYAPTEGAVRAVRDAPHS